MIKIQGPNIIKPSSDMNKISAISSKKRRIFIDIDGVLADWITPAVGILGYHPDEKDVRSRIKNGERIEDMLGLPTKEVRTMLFEKLDESWWANLDIFPWAEELIKNMQTMGSVCLLSSPGKHFKYASIACHGKTLWVEKNFPNIPFILTCYKEFCACSSSCLIDDSARNCEKFIKYGGKAFTFPNQYSVLDGEICIGEIIKNFRTYINKYF